MLIQKNQQKKEEKRKAAEVYLEESTKNKDSENRQEKIFTKKTWKRKRQPM